MQKTTDDQSSNLFLEFYKTSWMIARKRNIEIIYAFCYWSNSWEWGSVTTVTTVSVRSMLRATNIPPLRQTRFQIFSTAANFLPKCILLFRLFGIQDQTFSYPRILQRKRPTALIGDESKTVREKCQELFIWIVWYLPEDFMARRLSPQCRN